ncbi:GNAT family N-acetyltransferase [Paraburkholderia unamae]|uniref:Acetyltransferase n=1 Tax=Paraburkholderia unamae TaxID=219649 RepID=A0ABX5KES4_9BURK|nr:GNAT family N-acetyltransferase [Paraburkholderia unamae]PVX73550.1 putative acetyltransferase [Paraburkholderia unamae]CAG9246401.1 Putative acetyltransferase [Paraburkholderia unamae]
MFDDFATHSGSGRAPVSIDWRRYAAGRDAPALAALFRASVTTLAASHYDAAQRAAWAAAADDLAGFEARLARGVTLVAHCDGAAVAFGQLFPRDHVEMLYVAPAWSRRGLATALVARLEALARESRASVLSVDASALSRPVFERAGFSLISSEWVWRDGVSLPRFHLCKPLHAVNFSG